jgi:predicted nucleic acid-binding protein
MRLLLDTSVYSLAMRNHTAAVSLVRAADELIVCPVTVGELFAGFARGRREAANRSVFEEFISSPRVRLASISMDTGEFYAKILNDLRASGKPVPTNDIWIAACAMENGARVATADQHFRLVSGLLCVFVDAAMS